MKIVILNTSDTEGGAARANFRLFQAMKEINKDTTLITQNKDTDENKVLTTYPKLSKHISFLRYQIDYLPVRLYRNRVNKSWSPAWLKSKTVSVLNKMQPDITHLSWISRGFIPISDFKKISSPIVWTLHDMWAFTGGCHYSGDCYGYLKSCGNCPQLNSKREYDLSKFIWKQKDLFWNNLNLTIVTPSRWLANQAKSSSLFVNSKIEVIPNGLDLDLFKPLNKNIARDILNLPKDKKIIMFGATSALSDKRKGFIYLKEALKRMSLDSKNKEEIELVIFGSSKPEIDIDLGFKINYLGILYDEITMSIVYSCSDIFIAPSVEDNLPNTVMESLACGTPCIAFDIGGMSDMIDHKKNGYLVSPFDVEELEHSIKWCLDDPINLKRLSYNARSKVEEFFNINDTTRKYFNLYQEIINP